VNDRDLTNISTAVQVTHWCASSLFWSHLSSA